MELILASADLKSLSSGSINWAIVPFKLSNPLRVNLLPAGDVRSTFSPVSRDEVSPGRIITSSMRFYVISLAICSSIAWVSARAQEQPELHPPGSSSAVDQTALDRLKLAATDSQLAQFVDAQAQTRSAISSRIDALLRNFKPQELPPEPINDHNLNKVLDLGPLRQSSMITMSSVRPIKLEARYNEPLTLQDALTYAVQNNLPIRISRESWNYQRYQLWGQYADFLPSFSQSLNFTNSQIFPDTRSISRVFQTTVRFPVFQGGNAVYTALAQYYRDKGWRQAYNTTINDALLDVYQKYTNLELNNALLQIRTKSLEISEEQLQLNNALYRSGTGTQFAIMQSRTQLAADRQALLQQEVAVRQASLALAFSLNVPMAINLLPVDEIIAEQSLVDEKTGIEELVNLAFQERPELRQYELFRLAAARNVQVAASSLYPQVSFFTTFTHSSTSVFPGGSQSNLNGIANAQITSALNSNGLASNTALNQTASFSPTSSTTGNSGANTGATSVVAGSGGNPLNNVQSGSLVTSGAVAPSFASSTNVSGNNSTGFSTSNVNGSNTAGAGVFGGLFNTFQAGFALNWNLPNFGLGSVANIVSARALSRQALLQANQEWLLVTEQVRSAFLNAITARDQIDNAAYGTASASEALRLANLRLRAGTGTNLELIQAQRDFITALTAQVQAIIASNQAQAQILHDTGVISLSTLTEGYRKDSLPNSRKRNPAIKP